MNKVWLIIQREFLNRVQKKSFLLTTILTPLIFPALMGGLVYLLIREAESAKSEVVYVLDESGKFQFQDNRKFTFVKSESNIDSAKQVFKTNKYFGLLHIQPFEISDPKGFTIYLNENPSADRISSLERSIEDQIRDLKLAKYNIDKETLASLKTNVSLKQVSITETGEEKNSNSFILKGLGFVLGILLFVFILTYGMQIMQGVIDEKTSKIIEVIVSSVKPIQLMMGKILGIASVGLLQFSLWIIIMTVFTSAILGYFGLKMPQQQMQEQVMKQMDVPEEELSDAAKNPEVQEILSTISQIPFGKIVFVFLFFFLGGYLMYGALYAAVGSAVESIQESQQFQMPLMLPLMLGYMSVFTVIPLNPHGTLSFWLSIIPLTSPIVMVARIPYDVPTWELVLSMVLLVFGFLLTTWVAGRIYRVGILMTGAKINWKVMVKYFMMGK
jgi:ABC-2 type transport system permease protein